MQTSSAATRTAAAALPAYCSDDGLAIKHYTSLVEAGGEPLAYVCLAHCYEPRLRCDVADEAKASSLYFEAIKKGGMTPAQVEEELKRRVEEEGIPTHQQLDMAFNLGLWYLHGRFQGEKDIKHGLKMVEMAQRGGHGRAIMWYGVCHRLGLGMKRRDPSRALELFQMASLHGNIASLTQLGSCYEEGLGVERDYVKARELYEEAFKGGSAGGAFRLALIYRGGLGLPQADMEQCVRLYEEASSRGSAPAMNNLACFLQSSGGGEPKDLERAVALFERAAKMGHLGALFNLAVTYKEGHGVPKDQVRACQYYGEASERGHAAATFNLAVCLEYGRGVARNVVKAVQLYDRSAKQGVANAAFNLALCLEAGKGGQKHPQRAFQLYKQAANGGVQRAVFKLAQAYESGNGVEKDLEAAVRFYEKSSQQGNMEATFKAFKAYQTGRGVTKDLKKALVLCEEAASRGHEGAMYSLGLYYSDQGLGSDQARAAGLFERAASKGNEKAMLCWAWCLKMGCGVARDVPRAIKLYRELAEKGNAKALNLLGIVYERGEGVEPSLETAIKFYRRASNRGNLDGRINLALAYLEGKSVSQDPSKAMDLLNHGPPKDAAESLYTMATRLELGQDQPPPQGYTVLDLLQKAAQIGHPGAQWKLGKLYEKGQGGLDADPRRACELYQGSFAEGNLDAGLALANMYYHGVVERDVDKAIKILTELVEKGSILALNNLAAVYEKEGGKTNADYQRQAQCLYERAAEAGDPLGLFNVGRLAHFGRCGVEVDLDRAIAYYGQGCEKGHAESMVMLGQMHEVGQGLVKDQARALAWYQKASELGNREGVFCLARCWDFGIGVKRADPRRAVKLYSQAAGMGHVEAKFNLSQCYREGHGVKRRDRAKCIRLLQELVEGGHARAATNLGFMHEKGEGVTPCHKTAVSYYRQAAAKGDSNGAWNLALCYALGKGVKRDLLKASELCLSHVGLKDHPRVDPGLLFHLGLAFETGEVKKDIDRALALHLRASDLGHAEAAFAAARIYHGREDLEEGIELYEVAASRGHEEATVTLALLCRQGYGSAAIKDKAMEHLKKLADHGRHVEGLNLLGVCYEEGDSDKALQLYRQAASQGDDDHYALFNQGRLELEGATALACFLRAGERGFPPALHNAAVLLESGLTLPAGHENQSAADLYAKASELGHVKSTYQLGKCYQQGRGGVAKDLSRAAKLFQEAGARGLPNALFRAAFCHDQGDEEAVRDPHRAASLYRELSEGGTSTKAMTNLAVMVGLGEGVEQDIGMAFQLLEEASEKSDPYALYNLGALYLMGWGVEGRRDFEATARLFERATQTKPHPLALFNLGLMYAGGHGGKERDMTKALEMAERAAGGGLAEAWLLLGGWHLKGEGGIVVDISKAAECFRHAVKDESLSGPRREIALYGLSVCLSQGGEGLPQDLEQARHIWQSLAEGGHHANARAHTLLGICQELGMAGFGCLWGSQASAHYSKASESGDAQGSFRLGLCYLQGKGGLEKDVGKALERFLRAAKDSGGRHPAALFNAAAILERGCPPDDKGGAATEPDREGAVELYQKAADLGFVPALNALGVMCEMGTYEVKTIVDAVEYYKQAVAKEDPHAMWNLGRLCELRCPGQAKSLYKRASEMGHGGATARLTQLQKRGREE